MTPIFLEVPTIFCGIITQDLRCQWNEKVKYLAHTVEISEFSEFLLPSRILREINLADLKRTKIAILIILDALNLDS